MGYYINPTDNSSKEDWLERHAIVSVNPKWSDIPDGCLPLCWVDNGPFTAVAIAYDEEEFDDFMDPSDNRPKRWFVVQKEYLSEFLPERLTKDFLAYERKN